MAAIDEISRETIEKIRKEINRDFMRKGFECAQVIWMPEKKSYAASTKRNDAAMRIARKDYGGIDITALVC